MTAVSASAMTATAQTSTVQEQIPPVSSARTLLSAARRGLVEAVATPTAPERYIAANVVALRAATAVLAVRARPCQVSRGPRGVWGLLAEVAPELTEWAEFFAVVAGIRIALETSDSASDITVTERQADDLVREAETFCAHVAALLTRTCG
jgi:hypothetical protein